MLTLMIIRHAKAEPSGNIADFERRLTSKGEADASRLGQHLKRIAYRPDGALVSPSQRTRQTFALLAGDEPPSITARFEDKLYNATTRQLLKAICATSETVHRLAVIGHNPGLMDLAIELSGDSGEADLRRLRERFPPCALAVIKFAEDRWKDVRSGTGRLEFLLLPEDLRGDD